MPLFLLTLASCGPINESQATKSAPYYHLVASQPLTEQQGYIVKRRFSGVIQSKQSAELNFEVSGRVKHISSFEGDAVAKGKVLASLDSKLLLIEEEQLTSQLGKIAAEIKLTRANLTRIKSLISQGYTSEQNLDELNSQLQVLQASEKQLAASIKAKQYQIDHTEILAPFAGVVNQRNINIGEVVNSNKTAFVLQKQGENELKVGVPVNLVKQIKQKSQFNVIVDEQPIQVSKLAINSQINRQSRTVQLRFSLPNSVNVFNNQIAYFEFDQFYPQTGYWVPLTALTDGIRGTWNIYTLAPSDNDLFTIVSHSVELIHTEKERAFIRGSIKTDQPLLTSGLQRLVPGQLVKTAS